MVDRRLSKPPIVEALVDFRVRPSALQDVTVLREAGRELGREYPKVEERKALEFEVRHSASGVPAQATRDLGVVGYVFSTEDGARRVQFRRDGFTLNCLAPYPGGERVREEAVRTWQVYVQAAHPDEVTRVALRYINRIPIPDATFDLSDYLAAPPGLLPGTRASMIGMSHQSALEFGDSGSRANLLVSVEPQPNAGWLLTVDIDVFQLRSFGLDEDSLRIPLNTLRELKNEVFFGVLSERILKEFE